MKIIQALLDYYTKTRAVGHTHTRIHGAASQACIILAVDRVHAKLLNQQAPSVNAISMRQATNEGALLGIGLPLLIDNWTMITICQDVLEELNKKDTEILELKIRIGKMKQLAEDMGKI